MNRLNPPFQSVRIALGAFLLLALANPLFAAGPSPLAGESVWITIGADAFRTLQEEGFVFDHRPLREVDENDDVVLTQVQTRDIESISVLIHEKHQRCAGFLAHRTLEEAQENLANVSRSQLTGAPIDYIIDQPSLVNSLLPQLEAPRILNTISTLSTDFNNRYYLHPSGENGALWIRDLWQDFAQGRPEVTVELFDHSWRQPSVILTIPGSTLPDEVIVLGGHLDSTSPGTTNPNFLGPGADDNASGIATLSEVIRVAMANGFTPQRTVKFMGYAAEEVGLLGSQDIAGSFQSEGINVVAVLQLDMTAFNGSIEDIGLLSDHTNPVLTAFVADLIDTYLPTLQWVSTACGYGCSDHASWNARGYPAAMSFETRFGQHNSAIHSTGDTTAAFGNTGDHAVKFARLATAFMVEIGVDVSSIIFRDGFESGDLSAWTLSDTSRP